MRKIMIATAAISLMMAFAGVSSAAALQWNPQATAVSGSSNSTFTSPVAKIECNSLILPSWKATGAVLSGSGVSPQECFDWWNPYPRLSVKTAGKWSLTATSTSKATLSADTTPSGGPVLTFTYAYETFCPAIVIKGPISIPNQAWNNSTHELTLSAPLPISPSSYGCSLNGPTLNWTGPVYFPGVTITP